MGNKQYYTRMIIVAGVSILLVVIAAVYYFWSKTTNQTGVSNDRLLVTTSFYPLTFLVEGIAGDRAEVRTITPAGAEPHEYEPSTQDYVAIEKSAVLFLNGANFESWAKAFEQTLGVSAAAKVVRVAEKLALDTAVSADDLVRDPHIWLDPALAKAAAMIVRDALITADPAHEDHYRMNAAIFLKKFDELDTAYQKGLAVCAQRNIVTAHAAFGYLAHRYNLVQVPISGLSPDDEPSPRRMAEVAEFVKKNHVKYIFFESLISPELAETIAREVGVETLVLNPLEGLTPQEIEEGKNYFTEMEQNLINLRTALQCT